MTKFIPIRIREVEQRRDLIVAQALSCYYGQPVDVDRLTGSLLGILPGGIPRDAIFESVRYLAGRPIQGLDAIRLAWRLAGNIRTLKTGVPVAPWTVQRADEWVPLQILKVVKTRNSKDKIGYSVTSRVMAGSPAPLKTESFWGIKAMKFVAFKLGFSKPWLSYPFRHSSDLVGLRFFGLIEAARSRTQPEFHEIECPASTITWNRTMVLKLRLRVGQKCPNNYQHRCQQCAIGYDRCSAATHPKTFTIGYCAGCAKSDVPFDPDDHSPHCVNCAASARLRKKT